MNFPEMQRAVDEKFVRPLLIQHLRRTRIEVLIAKPPRTADNRLAEESGLYIRYRQFPADGWHIQWVDARRYLFGMQTGRLGPMKVFALGVASSCLAYIPATKTWAVVDP